MENSTNLTLLGQKISAPKTYDKSILQREERCHNRKLIGIDGAPQFLGYDIWNCWEVSCLTDSGLPVTAYAKIVYSSNSKYIVESKSLKLYFNSFNMTQMGEFPPQALKRLAEIVKTDLSEFLEINVDVGIFVTFISTPSIQPENTLFYKRWECIDYCDICGEYEYKENPNLLTIDKSTLYSPIEQYFFTTLLRSNCKITNQPDAGSAYIYLKGRNMICKKSLLKYIVSFREHQEFHENCAERIYTRIWDKFKPDELMVYCPYVRRGSLDINPIRASHSGLIPGELISTSVPFIKTSRQ